MADGIESFSESKNLARVSAGFKGGEYFSAPNLAPSIEVGKSYPAEVENKLKYTPTEQPPIQDVWINRRK